MFVSHFCGNYGNEGVNNVNGHSSITFSINGILSTSQLKSPPKLENSRHHENSRNNHENGNGKSSHHDDDKYLSDRKSPSTIRSNPNTTTLDYNSNITTAERTVIPATRYPVPFQLKINTEENYTNGLLKREYSIQNGGSTEYRSDNLPDLRNDYPANFYNRLEKYEAHPNSEWLSEQRITSPLRAKGGACNSASTGRFRPPPFFDTVLSLRKRLYYLGGKRFPIDEPPMDRNIHKLWRAVEKHKVTYSLQHYFYVASLSNRCFDLVEGINYKVSRGLLEGSREKELNQSYFNFLYGKTEDERYRYLCMLEKGEISPKNFTKSKHQHPANHVHQVNCPTCHKCEVIVKSLTEEKDEIKKQYASLKRKYDEMISSQGQSNEPEPDAPP